MFTQFYGMREQPFGVTPDSRFLYLGHDHREALASLYCGIRDHRGFLALIAPPGTGKTTLLFYLLQRLRAHCRTVYLFDTPSDPEDLMSCLAADVGLDIVGLGPSQVKQQFHKVLLAEANAGRTFVIVVDEAQNLSNPVLEKIRLLSNFESGTHKLLQVVLAGQPQLAIRLSHPDLVQLRQRIAMISGLEPLSADQVRNYVQHRLGVAGYRGEALFTGDALEYIATRSAGIPRLINILCYNALALGSTRKAQRIELSVIREAARELTLEHYATIDRPILSLSDREKVEDSTAKNALEPDKPPGVSESGLRAEIRSSFDQSWTVSRALTKSLIGVAALLTILLGATPELTRRDRQNVPRPEIELKPSSLGLQPEAISERDAFTCARPNEGYGTNTNYKSRSDRRSTHGG